MFGASIPCVNLLDRSFASVKHGIARCEPDPIHERVDQLQSLGTIERVVQGVEGQLRALRKEVGIELLALPRLDLNRLSLRLRFLAEPDGRKRGGSARKGAQDSRGRREYRRIHP